MTAPDERPIALGPDDKRRLIADLRRIIRRIQRSDLISFALEVKTTEHLIANAWAEQQKGDDAKAKPNP